MLIKVCLLEPAVSDEAEAVLVPYPSIKEILIFFEKVVLILSNREYSILEVRKEFVKSLIVLLFVF